MAEKALPALLRFLPLVFALGFLVPVIDQAMRALGWSAPLGLPTLTFAFILGGSWGLLASMRGSWI